MLHYVQVTIDSLAWFFELQVNVEGDGNTEMIGYSDICSDSDDSDIVREDNSDHSVGGYSARCSKSGKSNHIFQVLKQTIVFAFVLIA